MNGPHFDLAARPWWELVDPTLVEEYAELVRDTRRLQALYRRTQDPVMRRELPALEDKLDRRTAAVLDAIRAARREGGAR